MRPIVWLASRRLRETLSYYPGHTEEIVRFEEMVQANPLLGRPYVPGIPAIRALDKLWGDCAEPQTPYIPTLTWVYLYAPLADFLPMLGDLIIVLHLSGASGKQQVSQDDEEFKSIARAIVEIWECVKALDE